MRVTASFAIQTLALTAHVNVGGLNRYRPSLMQGRCDALSMQRKAVGQQT